MNTIGYGLLCLTTALVAGGCTVMGVTDEYEYIEAEGYHEHHINAYVPISCEVADIIEDRVAGYAMPPVERYSETIYPYELHQSNNIPSYVAADFNGDHYSDYAYMFSSVSYDHNYWYLSTRLLIVVSSPDGYLLSSDVNLGTVKGCISVPVEEYWGIRLLKPGLHSVETGLVEEGVRLDNCGIYLASLEPEERSVFFVDGYETEEIVIDFGVVAKRKADAAKTRAERVIEFPKKAL